MSQYPERAEKAFFPSLAILLVKGITSMAVTAIIASPLQASSDFCDPDSTSWLLPLLFLPAIVGVGVSMPRPTFGSIFGGGLVSALTLGYVISDDMIRDAESNATLYHCESTSAAIVIVPMCLAIAVAAWVLISLAQWASRRRRNAGD